MIFDLFQSPLFFVVEIIILVISLTIHELAHGLMADRLGDPTPRATGRLSLNPLNHLDPLGFVAMVFTRFGWGKPVMVNSDNFAQPIRDTALVSLAGPMSNIGLAIILSFLVRTSLLHPIIGFFCMYGASINIYFALFNLFPIHPLDGSKILSALLPVNLAIAYERLMYQYGLFILLIAVMPLYGGRSLISVFLEPSFEMLVSILLPR